MNKRFSLPSVFLFFSIATASLLLHWKIFDYDLMGNHSIRQAQTQLNIQNFYRYDSNILNPRINVLDENYERKIWRYEFPVMQWAVGMAYHITGESFLVTRICMFLIGLGSLAGMFYWLRQIFKDRFTAWAGTWALAFSPLFYYYTMNPMPDNLAFFGTLWSLAFFFKFLKTEKWQHAAWSAFFISLAIAAKLPFIVFLAVPGTWFLWNTIKNRFTNIRKEMRLAIVYSIFMFPTVLWYLLVIPTWQNGVIAGILANPLTKQQVIDTLNFHLVEMFPKRLLGYCAIPFLLFAGYFLVRHKYWQDNRFKLMAAMGIVVLLYWIFEFNMIGTVHDYYMMPFLPPLYLLVAFGINRLINTGKLGKWVTILLLACMPPVTYHISDTFWSLKPHLLADVFRHKEDLKNAAPAEARCIIVNDPTQHVFPYLIDKPGYVFRDDHLPAPWVEDMVIRHGVTYMYSDSRTIDTNPEISKYFEKLVMERGNVRVFQMKK